MIRIREQDAAHQRRKEMAILVALLVVAGVVVLASVGILAFSDKPNLQSWATGGLMTILSGFFGYFTGRQHPGR
jgi:hypothetical protein